MAEKCLVLSDRAVFVHVAISEEYGSRLVCQYTKIIQSLLRQSLSESSTYTNWYVATRNCLLKRNLTELKAENCSTLVGDLQKCTDDSKMGAEMDPWNQQNYDHSLDVLGLTLDWLKMRDDWSSRDRLPLHIAIIVTTKLPISDGFVDIENYCEDSVRNSTSIPSTLTQLSQYNTTNFIPMVFANCAAEAFMQPYTASILPPWRRILSQLSLDSSVYAITTYAGDLQAALKSALQKTCSSFQRASTTAPSFSWQTDFQRIGLKMTTMEEDSKEELKTGGFINALIILIVMLVASAVIIPTTMILEARHRRRRRLIRALDT